MISSSPNLVSAPIKIENGQMIMPKATTIDESVVLHDGAQEEHDVPISPFTTHQEGILKPGEATDYPQVSALDTNSLVYSILTTFYSH